MTNNDENIDNKTQIKIQFNYTIQKTPTQKSITKSTKQKKFLIDLTISKSSLDDRGYPDPRAMWFAEKTFLENFYKTHAADVRILKWKCHLENDDFVLSEYEVLLSPLER